MEEIYLIYRADFNNDEQSATAARDKKVLGFAVNLEEACRHIQNYRDLHKDSLYSGWDGHSYPLFFYQELRRI